MGLSIPSSAISLLNNAPCSGTSGFWQVTIKSTFVTPVPQLVELAAGGTALTAIARYPNTP
jgi:hypothetical protein